VKRKQVVPIAALAAVGVAALSLTIVASATQPHYQPTINGVALGPSVQHTKSNSDVLVQVATGALSTAAGSSNAAVPAVGGPNPTPNEQALLDMTNADRAQNGLPPVEFDPASLQVARVRSEAQSPDSPLSHYNTLGELAFVGLLADADVPYSLAGENLARATSQDATTVSRLNDALMNSPAHRANIVEPSFNLLAVGAAVDPGGQIVFAEIFRGNSQ